MTQPSPFRGVAMEAPPQIFGGRNSGQQQMEMPSQVIEMEMPKDVMSKANPNIAKLDRELIATLGLIKNDPKLMESYLRKQGYEDIQRQEDGTFLVNGQPLRDPGLSVDNLVFYAPEIVEAIVGGFSVAGKAVGAAAGGPAGFAAASGLGGLASFGVEKVKQDLAMFLGAREQLDPKELAKQTGLGAIAGAGGELVGRGLKKGIDFGKGKVSKMVQGHTERKFGGSLPKGPDKEAIQEAHTLIGGKPTIGQLTAHQTVRDVESVRSTLPFQSVATQRRVNEAVLQNQADALIHSRSKLPVEDSENLISKSILKDVKTKIGEAENLYKDIGDKLKFVPADTESVFKGIKKLKEGRLGASDKAVAFLNKMERKIKERGKSVEDLKDIRSIVFGELSDPNKLGNEHRAAVAIYKILSQARSSSFKKAMDRASLSDFELDKIALKEVTKRGGGLVSAFEPASKRIKEKATKLSPLEVKGLQASLKKADGIYASTAREIEKSIFKGKKLRGEIFAETEAKLEKLADTHKLQRHLLTGHSKKSADALKQLSPKAFEQTFDALIQETTLKSISKAQGKQGMVDPKKIADWISELHPEVAKMRWGEDGVKIAKAMQTIWRSLPGNVNPSGTAKTLTYMKIMDRVLKGVSFATLDTIVSTPAHKFGQLPIYGTILKELRKVTDDKDDTRKEK